MREDWITCTLGELLTLKNGFAFKSSNYISGGIPVIRIGDINDWIVDETQAKCVVENKEYDGYIVEKGDILIAMSGATTGKFGVYESDSKAYQNQRVGNLKPSSKDFIDKKYIFNLLYSLKYEIEKGAYGGAQPNISAGKIHALNTVLAPLPEQRAIVAKIEELFSDLDKGIADLKKAQDQLKVYRQAVLKKAFDGLDEVPFDQLVASSQNGMAKRRGSEGSETKVLRLADITNLEIDNSSPRSIILTQKEHEKYQLHEGDLLAIRVNGSIDLVGRFIHVTKKNESENWAFCDHLIRVTLNEERAVPKFYFYFFQLPEVRKFIHENMVSSAGQNTVSQGTVKAISVATTALEEQRQIVQEIESRLSVCDKGRR